MAERKAKKQTLEVYTSKNFKLVKDGLNIILTSGSGFQKSKSKGADTKIRITVEKI